MSLFSFLRKNKQAPGAAEGEFYSRAEQGNNIPRGRAKGGSRTSGSDRGNDPVDPVLPEKKRARRRLVGAIALVLAVVIGLPMILDSEPKPLADDITIQIPSKDKPPAPARLRQSAALDKNEELLSSAAPSAPATAKPIAPSAAVGTDVGAAAKSETKTDSKISAKPESKLESQPERKQVPTVPTAKAETDVAGRPEKPVKPQPDSSEVARANAILEGKSDDHALDVKPADKSSGKFVVQVAALASAEKVSELQGKLRDLGLKSYTQKVATQSGERIRVRLGPFASKEEADKVRAKLGKAGLNGSLVPS